MSGGREIESSNGLGGGGGFWCDEGHDKSGARAKWSQRQLQSVVLPLLRTTRQKTIWDREYAAFCQKY